MILQRLFARKPNPAAALYDAIVAAARQPRFFAEWGVPDTVDGRFDVIVLHLFLVLDRLKGEPAEIRQKLIDYFFSDMDNSLREMGVGDVSVGKKVRKMAEAFYGRLTAYSTALREGEVALVASIERNVYAGEKNVSTVALAHWVVLAHTALSTQPVENILLANLKFE